MAQQNILQTWQEMAKLWKTVKATYKPSEEEIALFEKFLTQVLKSRNKGCFKVLVLGATPEIRKLLYKYKLNVVLLDVEPVMVRAMNQLVEDKNPLETTVIGDWLSMPFLNNAFDLVMSDHPTSSVEYKNADKFFSEIQRVLKPDGHFIIDIHINAQLTPLTLEGYIKVYRDDKEWFADFNNKVLTQYQVIMGDTGYWNPKTFQSRWGKMDRMLHRKYEKREITKREYKDLKIGLGEGHVFNFYPKKAAKKVIEKYFKILNYNHIKSHLVYQYYWTCFARSVKKKQ